LHRAYKENTFMKLNLSILICGTLLFYLSGCASSPRRDPSIGLSSGTYPSSSSTNPYGTYDPSGMPQDAVVPPPNIYDEGMPAETNPSPIDPRTNRQDSPPSSIGNQPSIPPQNRPPAPPRYPKGIVVEGKPGYVRSPFAEHTGLVDVRGYPSGTEVRCPYTNKIFVVP
jgi:hypothetical protein